jgi:hypothetical protein
VRHDRVLFAKMLLQQGADPKAQNNVRARRGRRAARTACRRTLRPRLLTPRPPQNEATAMSLAQSDEMRAVLKQAGERPRA